MGVSIGRNVEVSMKKGGFWMYGRKRFGEKAEVFVEMWGFHGGMIENRGFGRKMRVFRGAWLEIEVLVEKLGFLWKNGGFFEKWGFRGFLVKKSGKSRKEPGI